MIIITPYRFIPWPLWPNALDARQPGQGTSGPLTPGHIGLCDSTWYTDFAYVHPPAFSFTLIFNCVILEIVSFSLMSITCIVVAHHLSITRTNWWTSKYMGMSSSEWIEFKFWKYFYILCTGYFLILDILVSIWKHEYIRHMVCNWIARVH